MTGKKIRNIRARLNLTQQALADKLGITRDAVKMWEMGLRKPSALAVAAINCLLRLEAMDTGKARAGQKGKKK